MTSYGQILRSSSIMGGTAAVGMLIGMVSAKASAVFLGVAGVGEMRLYQNLGGLFAALTGFGICTSAVRALASAEGVGNDREARAIESALHRLCWLTGVFGCLMLAVFARPLSDRVFEGAVGGWSVAVYGVTILLGALAGGNLAVLQARREIVSISKANLMTAACTAALAVGSYWMLGREGILPALIGGSVIQLAVANVARRRISRRAPAQGPPTSQSWPETLRIAAELALPGAAFMAGLLLPPLTQSMITALIVRELGLDANGLYWAAWSLSGLFSNFVIGAMGTDYLPRVSAASHDADRAGILANEQIEIGLLLGTPGVVAMMVLAPVALNVFYTAEFLGASTLVLFFGWAIVVQLSGWPIGFLVLAKGRSRLFIAMQVAWLIIQMAATWAGMRLFGLPGSALAFLVFNVAAELLMWIFVHRRIDFRWSPRALTVMGCSWTLCALAAASTRLPETWSGIAGLCAIALSGIVTVRGLAGRLGDEHRLVRAAQATPVLRTIVKLAAVRATRGPR